MLFCRLNQMKALVVAIVFIGMASASIVWSADGNAEIEKALKAGAYAELLKLIPKNDSESGSAWRMDATVRISKAWPLALQALNKKGKKGALKEIAPKHGFAQTTITRFDVKKGILVDLGGASATVAWRTIPASGRLVILKMAWPESGSEHLLNRLALACLHGLIDEGQKLVEALKATKTDLGALQGAVDAWSGKAEAGKNVAKQSEAVKASTPKKTSSSVKKMKPKYTALIDFNTPQTTARIREADGKHGRIIDSPDGKGKCLEVGLIYPQRNAVVGLYSCLLFPKNMNYKIGPDRYLEFEIYYEGPREPGFYFLINQRQPARGYYTSGRLPIIRLSPGRWEKRVVCLSQAALAPGSSRERIPHDGETYAQLHLYADEEMKLAVKNLLIRNLHFYQAEPLEKRAEDGDAESQFFLGWTCTQTPPDMQYNNKRNPKWPLAIKWLTKAAEQGHEVAMYELASMLSRGWGAEKDLDKAEKWVRKAAMAKNLDVRMIAANWLTRGKTHRDLPFAFERFMSAAKEGLGVAQHQVANMYSKGQGVEKNDKKALEWFKKSAEQGLMQSFKRIGDIYANGRGVPKDQKEADRWYQKAEDNDREAQTGKTVIASLTNRAKRNDLKAIFKLGQAHGSGWWGLKKSAAEASKWHELGAGKGHAGCQWELGRIYEYGWSRDKDTAKALELYKKAADQGFALAKQAYDKLKAKVGE